MSRIWTAPARLRRSSAPPDAGGNPIGVAVDPAAGKLYWAALESGQIRVGNLDGTGTPASLFQDEDSPAGVALDPAGGKIYWASFWAGRIRSGNLDGSGTPATLYEFESLPILPALVRAPVAGEQLPAISGGASLGDPLSCGTGSWKADLSGAHLFRAPRTFAYQWQLDGNDIPGAASASFTFAEAGDYTCRVTATNEGGSTSQTSAAFTVTLLDVVKYYDVNTNGQLDPTESTLAGWRVQVGSTAYTTPKSLKVDPGVYQVTEANPTQSNWRRTTAAPIQVSATAGARTTARFGNVCVGGGGALGTGFWLKASATNMAYDLSAQLAVMSLNVLNGKVNGSSLIAAPGATGANAAGFATVNSLMTEANTELGLHGLTPVGNAFRAYQTALRDAFVNANDNKTFVQSAPCAFSFP